MNDSPTPFEFGHSAGFNSASRHPAEAAAATADRVASAASAAWSAYQWLYSPADRPDFVAGWLDGWRRAAEKLPPESAD